VSATIRATCARSHSIIVIVKYSVPKSGGARDDLFRVQRLKRGPGAIHITQIARPLVYGVVCNSTTQVPRIRIFGWFLADIHLLKSGVFVACILGSYAPGALPKHGK